MRGGELIVQPTNLPGLFAVDARSHLAQRVLQHGAYEPDMLPLLLKLWPGHGTCINVGANVGYWAVSAALVLPGVDEVVAIEPNREAFSRLLHNIALNGVGDKVRAIQACATDSACEVEMSVIDGKSEYSSIGRIVHPSVEQLQAATVRVRADRLECLVSPTTSAVTLLLIDAEGAEYLVLDGGREILFRDRPAVIFECSARLLHKFGHSVPMILDLFAQVGYRVYDPAAPSRDIAHDHNGDAVAVPVNGASGSRSLNRPQPHAR